MEKTVKRLERQNELLKAIVDGVKNFVSTYGKLDDDDLAYIVEHYAEFLPRGAMLEVFERIKFKRFGGAK